MLHLKRRSQQSSTDSGYSEPEGHPATTKGPLTRSKRLAKGEEEPSEDSGQPMPKMSQTDQSEESEPEYWGNCAKEYFMGIDGLFHVVKARLGHYQVLR